MREMALKKIPISLRGRTAVVIFAVIRSGEMRAILFLLAFAFAGCSTPTRYAGVEPEVRKPTPVKTICITSVPAGCIVEMNGEYIGQTPFTLTVDADNNGCWPRYHPNGGMRTFSNSFVCTTPNGFSDHRSWTTGDPIPGIVIFRPLGRYPVYQPLRMNAGS
jgi:hypothetical protein